MRHWSDDGGCDASCKTMIDDMIVGFENKQASCPNAGFLLLGFALSDDRWYIQQRSTRLLHLFMPAAPSVDPASITPLADDHAWMLLLV